MLFYDDRWVERRRGRVVFTKVAAMDVEGERASMLDPQGGTLFTGSAAELLEGLRASARDGGRSHISQGRPLGPVSYPWFSLPFAYLLTACVEHLGGRGGEAAYHAGGFHEPVLRGGRWLRLGR